MTKSTSRGKSDNQRKGLFSKIGNKLKDTDKQYIPEIYKKTILWKPIWIILPIIGILLEITFYFVIDSYRNRGVKLYGSILAYIILGISGIILAHCLTKFHSEFLSIKKNLEGKLKKTLLKGKKQSPKRREKMKRILKIVFAFPYILIVPFLGIVFFILILLSFIVVKTGVLYPNIVPSYFMIILNYVIFIGYFSVIFAYLSNQFKIVFTLISLVKKIDIQKLEFPNIRRDPPEGFKKIGYLVLKLTVIPLITAGSTVILTSFEILFDLNITVGISLLPEFWVDNIIRHNLNYLYICIPVILFVAAFLPPQIHARRKIKEFKEAKLSPLRAKRTALLKKLTSDTQDSEYFVELVELEKTDYLITQVELIRNGTLNISINITFVIGNLIAVTLGLVPFLVDFFSS